MPSNALQQVPHGTLIDYLPIVRLEKYLPHRILEVGQPGILPQKAEQT